MQKIERKTFDRKSYLQYLKSRLDEFELAGFYNVFLHQIGRIDDFDLQGGKSYQEAYEEKIISILKNGLLVGKYGSIGGTLKLVEECSKVDVSQIISYSFDDRVEHNAVAIFAIPKYVHLGGNTVELSSYKGQSLANPILKNNLAQMYKMAGLRLSERDMKFCAYDLVKSRMLPNIFLLGIQEIDKTTGEICFVSGSTHIAHQAGIEKELAYIQLSQIAQKVFDKVGQYGSIRAALLGEVQKEEREREMLDVEI